MTNIISMKSTMTKLPKMSPDVGDIIDGVCLDTTYTLDDLDGVVIRSILLLDEKTISSLHKELGIAKQKLGAVAIEGDKIRVTTTEKYDWFNGDWKEVEG